MRSFANTRSICMRHATVIKVAFSIYSNNKICNINTVIIMRNKSKLAEPSASDYNLS